MPVFRPSRRASCAPPNYAGGSEFAAVALWSTVPPVLMILVTTWLINSRHIMLSASLTLYMGRLTTLESLFVLFFMCDEAWALAMQDVTRMKKLGRSNDEAFSLPFYAGSALALWTSWWGSAAVGAWIGNDLGDLEVWGFAMAFPGDFHRHPLGHVAGRLEVPAVDRELCGRGPHEPQVFNARFRCRRIASGPRRRVVHDGGRRPRHGK